MKKGQYILDMEKSFAKRFPDFKKGEKIFEYFARKGLARLAKDAKAEYKKAGLLT